MKIHPRLLISVLAGLLFFAFSCGGDAELAVPKPRTFPRILYPERVLNRLTPPDCPFSFSFPNYAKVEQKTLFFDEAPAHPCWFDLYIPAFDGRLHFSYYPLKGKKDWEEKRKQAFDLVGFHNKKASNIIEHPIDKVEDIGGMAFEINGPAASPYQFFLSDSSQHFVRAALYFNTQARPDSMRPIVQYVVEDIQQLIAGFKWE